MDASENRMEFRTGRSALRLNRTARRTVPTLSGAATHHAGGTRFDISDVLRESVGFHRHVEVASRIPVALLHLSAAAHGEAGTIGGVPLTGSRGARRRRTTTPRPRAS
jgi:hypothetical protein